MPRPVLAQERAVTGGHDHTCRVWKVPEESQLIFRAHSPAIDAVRYVTGTQWLSGGADGSLALWSQMKKRPMSVVRGAHCRSSSEGAGAADAAGAPAGIEAASWVQSVAVCRGTDLVVRHPGPALALQSFLHARVAARWALAICSLADRQGWNAASQACCERVVCRSKRMHVPKGFEGGTRLLVAGRRAAPATA
jgi:ribosomal RNA-processing protein 9